MLFNKPHLGVGLYNVPDVVTITTTLSMEPVHVNQSNTGLRDRMGSLQFVQHQPTVPPECQA
jgi:hypothetical protein